MKQIICPICGLKFETNRPNKKYCSFSCKEAGRFKQRMKWEAENPGYINGYMKEYRERKKRENDR